MVSAAKAVMMSNRGRRPYNPLADIPDLLFFNNYRSMVPAQAGTYDASSSHSRSIVASGGRFQTSLNGAAWYGQSNIGFQGATVVQTGYVNPGNNGTFQVLNATNVYVEYVNPAGVAETVGVGVGAATVRLSGFCNAYNDLVGGQPMTTGGVPFSCNENLLGGVRVLAAVGNSSTSGRALGVNAPALASGFQGGAFTMFSFFRPESVNISGQTAWMAAQVGAGSSGSLAHARYTTAGDHTLFLRDASGGTATYAATLTTPLQMGVWQLLALTFSGSTATWYREAVQVGQATVVPRVLTAMDLVYVGIRGSYPSGGAGTSGYRAVDGAVGRALTVAELTKLRDWCRAEYPGT